MGRGIMQWAVEAGADVIAFDTCAGAAEEACRFVNAMLDRSVVKGRIAADARDDMTSCLRQVAAIGDISSCDIVIEAIVEDLDAKRRLFAGLEDVVSDQAILCTNTSSLSVTACAGECRLPGRVAGMHFFNPVPLMKVVEVVRGERTDASVVERLLELVRRSSHRPVVCSDTPGFVVNHAGRGLYTEGLRILREGVAGYADVDRVMRDCAGFPMGPFELFDLTGLDVSSKVLREIYESFFHERRYQPSPMVYRRVAAGLYGRKSGQGFYGYADGRKVEPPEAEIPAVCDASFIIDAAPEIEASFAANLVAGGLRQVQQNAEIIVVAPLGTDATTAAVAGGHDPSRVVAIDPLAQTSFDGATRATIMGTPVTSSEALDAVHAALIGAGYRVTRITDSPGFILQRVLATIVNIACEIAQQRIASPDDIEAGVKLGLGYPQGPFDLGDSIGAAVVLKILEGLQACTSDPRYAPSLWLRRRAMLGLSLSTPD